MTTRTMTISYQNRQGVKNSRSSAPKLIIANHFLTQNGFPIGSKIVVHYAKNIITINKLIETT